MILAKKLSAYNRYMARALKGKMRGKTKAQRKAIFKAAAKGWKKESRTRTRIKKGAMKRATTQYRSRSRTKTRKSNPVSKKRGFLSTQTFMKFARLAALAAPAAAVAMGTGDAPTKIQEGIRIYTGYNMADGSFSLANAAQGWLPFVATSVLTYGISKLNGIIRRI